MNPPLPLLHHIEPRLQEEEEAPLRESLTLPPGVQGEPSPDGRVGRREGVMATGP